MIECPSTKKIVFRTGGSHISLARCTASETRFATRWGRYRQAFA